MYNKGAFWSAIGSFKDTFLGQNFLQVAVYEVGVVEFICTFA